MDVYEQELLNFYRCLNNQEVAYILVGGFATNFHGYLRLLPT